MVDRCEKEIVAVDLDGTLYKGSSLKRFFKYGALYALNRFDIFTVMKILYYIVLERLGKSSHREMKYNIVYILEKKISDNGMKEFVSILKSELNSDVVSMIMERQRNGAVVVLTTASPASYSQPLALELNIDEVCATATTASIDDYVENRGTKKVEAMKAVIKRCNGHLATVITDHSDDIPLMQFNVGGNNILVNPLKCEVEKIKNAGIRFVMTDLSNQL